MFLVLAIGVTIFALNLYRKLPSGDTRTLLMMAYLGLVTYFIHGVLNNYLDTDKASVPFWGFIAVLVAIDLYHKDHSIEVETSTKPSTT
jgi:hypothetical protein